MSLLALFYGCLLCEPGSAGSFGSVSSLGPKHNLYG